MRDVLQSVSQPTSRQRWVEICAVRMRQLSPLLSDSHSLLLAERLWVDVGAYDPVLSAEMEFESGGLDSHRR